MEHGIHTRLDPFLDTLVACDVRAGRDLDGVVLGEGGGGVGFAEPADGLDEDVEVEGVGEVAEVDFGGDEGGGGGDVDVAAGEGVLGDDEGEDFLAREFRGGHVVAGEAAGEDLFLDGVAGDHAGVGVGGEVLCRGLGGVGGEVGFGVGFAGHHVEGEESEQVGAADGAGTGLVVVVEVVGFFGGDVGDGKCGHYKKS